MNDNPEAQNINQQIPSQSFWDRISPNDVLVISSDLFPSIIFIGFIMNSVICTEKYCTESFSTILKSLMFIYSAFVIKALLHTLFICVQSESNSLSKISLQTLDFILNL